MAPINTPTHFAPVSQETHSKWTSALKEYGILYLYGMFGRGKTLQALHFAKIRFKEHNYFSANNPDFLDEVEGFFAQFKKGRVNTLLILDDIHHLTQNQEQQRLFIQLLKRPAFGGRLQIMLLSRGRLPHYLLPLRITQYLTVADGDCLLLKEEEIFTLFATHSDLGVLTPVQLQKTVNHCLTVCQGYPLCVQAYLQHICANPQDRETAAEMMKRDAKYLVETQMFARWPKSHQEALIRLGAFPSFTPEMAELVLRGQSKELLDDFLQMGGFLRFEAPDTYHIHPMFFAYLEEKLSQQEEGLRNRVYQQAARYYEEHRMFDQALRCYQMSQRTDKILQIVVYLLENAEGCIFAELSAPYMDALSMEKARENPSVMGAKAMLAAYRMEPDESRRYLGILKEMAEEKGNVTALSAYVRTLIASPCVTANEMKKNLLMCSRYVSKYGVVLENIMPTGNFPSVINGGLDLLQWVPQYKTIFPLMKGAVTLALGKEGVGAPDTSLGEFHYEQGDSTRAMVCLTCALSDSNFKGSIRVQYAATSIMARLFQSEGQLATAQEILQNIHDKASQHNFTELLPNIGASLVQGALLAQDEDTYTRWLDHAAPDEHKSFYITTRFALLTKARVYVALGREIEALGIHDHLQHYATLYHRLYMEIELLILKAIVLYRRQEDWRTPLLEGVNLAQPYHLVRIFADQGAALRPLWQEMDWTAQPKEKETYITAIGKGIATMAGYYPKYLQPPHQHRELLTAKELNVLALLAQGANNTQIAQSLEITLGTAKFHVSNIIKKLGAENRTAAAKIAQEQGLV